MRIELLRSSTPVYVNPNQIVCVFQDAGRPPYVVLGNGGGYEVKQESYDRIVEWMEGHDGERH